MEKNCIFCDIIDRKTDTEIEFENDKLVIFKDIKPASKYHYLAVSKVHIKNVKSLKLSDKPLIENMEISLREHMKSKGYGTEDASLGFHWPPFTSVDHLHMHGITPVSTMSIFKKQVYRSGTGWFFSSDYVKNWLK